ncbi:hypothetical protein AWZ03_011495 [Drosophila navojoa]|uniref:Zasp-like motif domain-containing protein n=1 Tax=Drosophila navojoa TaxID=7232 RepID=A0A484B079_DRONA|nr:hypothetical protein AWZ03_011495 [Drosophila navojoa]
MPAIMYVLSVLLLLAAVCLQREVECATSTASPRTARIMQFLREPPPSFHANRRVGVGPGQGPRLRPNGDNLRPPTPWRPPMPPPVLAGQQLLRREFNGNWPYAGNGGNRFAHSKDAAPVLDVGKNQFYRPKEAPQFNYNVNQYTPNFKASPPHYNVNKEQPQKFPGYTPIKQYAIPMEASKYVANYAETPTKQPQQLAQAASGYAVYEDTDNVKNVAPFANNYQQTSQLSKEAESYLHFMSTNDYFLPRREPNYKQLDLERDQINYQQQRLVQQQQQQQHQQQQQQQQHQQQLLDSSVSSSYNKPLRVADLFYQQDPAPHSSTVVRGSYQAGQNAFVVKSDGNKSVKHILSTSLTPRTTQVPPASTYSHVRHGAQKTVTPEPVRFEFTEHDAIRGSASYTNAPHGQKYYYETHTAAPPPPQTPAVSVAPIPESVAPVKEEPKESAEYDNKVSLFLAHFSIFSSN